MDYRIVVVHNGQRKDATLEVTEKSERRMGADVTWEVTLDDETVVMTISEYPEGEFTEVERDPALATRMEDIVDVILNGRHRQDETEE